MLKGNQNILQEWMLCLFRWRTDEKDPLMDQAKGLEVVKITYYENGKVVEEDESEIETAAFLQEE